VNYINSLLCALNYIVVYSCFSIYDVNEREKNEEKKEKKHFVALTGCISFKRKMEKFSVSCATTRVQF
jgi:hypothetical protein